VLASPGGRLFPARRLRSPSTRLHFRAGRSSARLSSRAFAMARASRAVVAPWSAFGGGLARTKGNPNRAPRGPSPLNLFRSFGNPTEHPPPFLYGEPETCVRRRACNTSTAENHAKRGVKTSNKNDLSARVADATPPKCVAFCCKVLHSATPALFIRPFIRSAMGVGKTKGSGGRRGHSTLAPGGVFALSAASVESSGGRAACGNDSGIARPGQAGDSAPDPGGVHASNSRLLFV